jgi:hypothetical protein
MSRRNVGGGSGETKKRVTWRQLPQGPSRTRSCWQGGRWGDVVVGERGENEGEKRGDLATTTPGTVTNKGAAGKEVDGEM